MGVYDVLTGWTRWIKMGAEALETIAGAQKPTQLSEAPEKPPEGHQWEYQTFTLHTEELGEWELVEWELPYVKLRRPVPIPTGWGPAGKTYHHPGREALKDAGLTPTPGETVDVVVTHPTSQQACGCADPPEASAALKVTLPIPNDPIPPDPWAGTGCENCKHRGPLGGCQEKGTCPHQDVTKGRPKDVSVPTSQSLARLMGQEAGDP